MTYGELKHRLEELGVTDDFEIINLEFDSNNDDPWWVQMFTGESLERGFKIYQQPEHQQLSKSQMN